MSADNATQHRWQFARSGGFDQVRLETAADLANLEHLDQKLWAALACPVVGLEFDERTLALVDGDGDGRVRAPEVLAAVQWCEDRLRDLATLRIGTDAVALVAIDDQSAGGKALLASARQLLKSLGRPAAAEITLADVNDTARAFAGTSLNGDGIVPADAAGDDKATKQAIEEAIGAVGAVTDRSGKPGVDQGKVDAFFAQLAAFDAWSKAGEDAALSPLGAGTAAAAEAWSAVKAKVDDYFARCRLAAFDARALAALNRKEEEYLAIAAADMSITSQEVAGFPLSRIEARKALDLVNGLNPAWAGAIGTLRSAAVEPLLGKGKALLTAEEWAEISAKLGPFAAWRGAKPASSVESLGLARVRALLAGGAKAAIEKLIAADAALAGEYASIADLERLVRYKRDLYRLLHNFVNFGDFYSRQRPAVFQAGTLYLDQRACSLCVRVGDAGKHAALAGLSRAYLAYCDCTRPGGEKMQIAAAFTNGDSDYLMVGRNGVFYDRQGRDWDATITKVVENPISVRQAFWSPYKKLVRLIEELVAKRAAAAETKSDAQVGGVATAGVDQAAAPKPEAKKIDVGTVAALGVAVGALGVFLTAVIGYVFQLFDLPFWQLALALAGILLVISTPSMLIAWLKLRQRNLGPILDSNGWAVNGRVKLNVPFGASLTTVAALPPGSIPAPDPFGERPSPWPKVLKFVLVVLFLWSLLNWFGLIHRGLTAAGVNASSLPGFITSPEAADKR